MRAYEVFVCVCVFIFFLSFVDDSEISIMRTHNLSIISKGVLMNVLISCVLSLKVDFSFFFLFAHSLIKICLTQTTVSQKKKKLLTIKNVTLTTLFHFPSLVNHSPSRFRRSNKNKNKNNTK